MMRKYNFGVEFAPVRENSKICSVILNSRFDPDELLGDFPKNVTSRFIEALGAKVAYQAGALNSIDVILSNPELVSDVERAVVLNLIDFGQDYEKMQSTTIDKVIFYVLDSSVYDVDKLSEALERKNADARAFMTKLMTDHPYDDEDALTAWPDQLFGYYYYGLKVGFGENISNDHAEFVHDLLGTFHQVNMWNGFNAQVGAKDAAEEGRTGVSYEIEMFEDGISYEVERPSCDPAISIEWFCSLIEKKLGLTPKDWEIYLTPAD